MGNSNDAHGKRKNLGGSKLRRITKPDQKIHLALRNPKFLEYLKGNLCEELGSTFTKLRHYVNQVKSQNPKGEVDYVLLSKGSIVVVLKRIRKFWTQVGLQENYFIEDNKRTRLNIGSYRNNKLPRDYVKQTESMNLTILSTLIGELNRSLSSQLATFSSNQNKGRNTKGSEIE